MTLKERYGQLNDRQKQVVDTYDKNILLLASAGTGKTNTLSLRIAGILVKKLALGEQILCLTFTNRACKEMNERISQITGGTGNKISVRTFHSFCFELIKEYARFTDLSADMVIYDEDDCRELLLELDLSAMQSDNYQAVQRFIDHIKEQRILNRGHSSNELVKLCYKQDKQKLEQIFSVRGSVNQTQYRFILKYGGALVDKYDRLLTERHAVDFNDILQYAENALSNDDYADYSASKYKFILVDEVQDTSVLEYNIIQRLFKYSNIMLCGDYFQTIYQWRGSKPRDIFGRFTDQYKPIRIVFDQSYRSTQILLNASYDFLNKSFPEQVKQIYGGQIRAFAKEAGEKIRLKSADSIKEEAGWIFKTIDSLRGSGSIAVLCRSNIHAQKLSDQLLQNNLQREEEWIDFLLTDQYKFFRSGEIKDIIAFLKYIVNPYDDTSLARIIMKYVRNVGLNTIQKLESRQNYLLGIRLHDFANQYTHEFGDPYGGLIQALDGQQVIVFDVESTGTNTAEDEIIQIAAVQIDSQGKVVDSYERFLKPEKGVGLSEQVHHFSDKFLAENGQDPKEVLSEFSKYIEGKTLVGHNVGYDITILTSQTARLKLPPTKYKAYYDTLDMARRFYPLIENHKLETLSKMLDTETKSSHDAMDDILATKDLLIHMLKQEHPKHLEQRREVYENNIKQFKKLSLFLMDLREKSRSASLSELLGEIMEAANMKKLHSEQQNIRNMQELLLLAKEVEQNEGNGWDNISEFIQLAALSATSLDRLLALKPRIPVITVHQAKGAEFDHVFLAGLQDDTFPSYFSVKSGDLSEERRTFYVAMTRAKKCLYLSCCRNIDGRPKQVSRFIKEIPQKYIAYE